MENNTEKLSHVMRYRDCLTQELVVNGVKITYRVTGEEAAVPVFCFNHLAGVLDNWDPRVIDGLALKHQIVTFNHSGIGSSEGNASQTVEEMVEEAIDFIRALGYTKVDLLGFSLGGGVAQGVVLKDPKLVRKLVLAGTGPKGGIGIKNIPGLCYRMQLKSLFTFTNVLAYLFFTQTKKGRRKAKEFLGRLKERSANRDDGISLKAFRSQLKAIRKFGLDRSDDLSVITQPVLIANGEDDLMVPSINSAHMYLEIPNAKLVLYKDAGHGGVFQYHREFVSEVLDFLSS